MSEGEEAAPPSQPRHILEVEGSKFDLNGLFGFVVLQDLLRSLSRQRDAQMELITKLREDLETANRNGDETAKRLKAEIDLKATEKALTALALETSRDKTAMQRQHESFENEVGKRFTKHEQRLESQQSKLYDCKVALDTKAESRTVDALTTRVDSCSTAVELADAKIALKARIDEVEAATTARHQAAEVLGELHDKRISQLEDTAKTLATKAELEALGQRCHQADEKQVRACRISSSSAPLWRLATRARRRRGTQESRAGRAEGTEGIVRGHRREVESMHPSVLCACVCVALCAG